MFIKYIVIRDREICGLISFIFGNGLGRLGVVYELNNLYRYKRVKLSLFIWYYFWVIVYLVFFIGLIIDNVI